MTKPTVLVLRSPGTNCDLETVYAFELAGANVISIHINELIDKPIAAEKCQVLCFPGGFSYGDDISAGRILASRFQNHLSDLIEKFREEDRLMLGICNGFQVMMRMGVFFDQGTSSVAKSPATLTWNRQGRFEDRWVHLKTSSHQSPFLKDIESIYLPMAHAEGRFVFRSEIARGQMAQQNQIALQYCDSDGQTSETILPYPVNPNGADLNVAGITDSTGRFFGLMPHPERHLFPTHHPTWTRTETLPEYGEGLAIFQNAVRYFE
jgi:phosphoribosylformylglycinamidine synthase